MEFSTSLVREKFVIREKGVKDDTSSIVALSNRIVVPLHHPKYKSHETFIVRTQNMHSCARFAALIAKEFQEHGAIMDRIPTFDWKHAWTEVTKGYERDWNPDIWGVVYFNGKPVFQAGEYHAFLDIIEQCDIKNKGAYTESIAFAESAFSQAGKDVEIDYDSNVALVLSVKPEETKCGVIVRSASKTTTFNFSAKARGGGKMAPLPSQSLTVSAAFLEGIQLAFQVGLYHKKTAYKLIERFSDEDKKGERSVERVAALNKAIDQYERMFNVYYRPDRPSFRTAIIEAEEVAMKILGPQIKKMMESGELDPDDWVE